MSDDFEQDTPATKRQRKAEIVGLDGETAIVLEPVSIVPKVFDPTKFRHHICSAKTYETAKFLCENTDLPYEVIQEILSNMSHRIGIVPAVDDDSKGRTMNIEVFCGFFDINDGKESSLIGVEYTWDIGADALGFTSDAMCYMPANTSTASILQEKGAPEMKFVGGRILIQGGLDTSHCHPSFLTDSPIPAPSKLDRCYFTGIFHYKGPIEKCSEWRPRAGDDDKFYNENHLAKWQPPEEKMSWWYTGRKFSVVEYPRTPGSPDLFYGQVDGYTLEPVCGRVNFNGEFNNYYEGSLVHTVPQSTPEHPDGLRLSQVADGSPIEAIFGHFEEGVFRHGASCAVTRIWDHGDKSVFKEWSSSINLQGEGRGWCESYELQPDGAKVNRCVKIGRLHNSQLNGRDIIEVDSEKIVFRGEMTDGVKISGVELYPGSTGLVDFKTHQPVTREAGFLETMRSQAEHPCLLGEVPDDEKDPVKQQYYRDTPMRQLAALDETIKTLEFE